MPTALLVSIPLLTQILYGFPVLPYSTDLLSLITRTTPDPTADHFLTVFTPGGSIVAGGREGAQK